LKTSIVIKVNPLKEIKLTILKKALKNLLKYQETKIREEVKFLSITKIEIIAIIAIVSKKD
jgi:hypothetical protein